MLFFSWKKLEFSEYINYKAISVIITNLQHLKTTNKL